jgi:hypothetical protein
MHENVHVVVCFDSIANEGRVKTCEGFFIIQEIRLQLALGHQIEGRSRHSCLDVCNSETFAHQIATLVSLEAVKLCPWLATELRCISNMEHRLTGGVIPSGLSHCGAILLHVLVEAIHKHEGTVISPELCRWAVHIVEPQLSPSGSSDLLIAGDGLFHLLFEKNILIVLRRLRSGRWFFRLKGKHNCWWWSLPHPCFFIHCLAHLSEILIVVFAIGTYFNYWMKLIDNTWLKNPNNVRSKSNNWTWIELKSWMKIIRT